MYSNYAIDDVNLLDKVCPNIYECGFESKCGWRNVIDKNIVQLTWLIGNGQTSTQNTGPSTDSAGNPNGFFKNFFI